VNRRCETANAEVLHLPAEVEVCLKFEDGERVAAFWVADKLSAPVILGHAFLMKYKAILD